MTLVLTAVPAGLRGDLTKWLIEISAGVFVGDPGARIREELWQRVVDESVRGRAIMVYNAATEQGFTVRTHNHDWQPRDFDGAVLMHRPSKKAQGKDPKQPAWSLARARQKSLRPSWAERRDAASRYKNDSKPN
ncbi:type I-E CRISPR-associated endoribonuclease Cas2e [Gulosibacter sp. GYB002]|uniref:type I-E CRISPR-associated endoribonuclease Cas2e n=1 Tax=Gulosibacter sp. GYB002 TaxID=2994391 RepID=UPI002F9659D8